MHTTYREEGYIGQRGREGIKSIPSWSLFGYPAIYLYIDKKNNVLEVKNNAPLFGSAPKCNGFFLGQLQATTILQVPLVFFAHKQTNRH